MPGSADLDSIHALSVCCHPGKFSGHIALCPSLLINPLSPAESQQSNESLTPSQIAVVLENISSRQKDLQYTEKTIREENLKSAANAASIAHLEPAISRATLAITAQKQVLAELVKMKAKLEEVNSAAGPNWVETSDAQEICAGVMDRVENQTKDYLEKFAHQISQFEKNILALSANLQVLELEVYGQRLMQDASKQYVSSLLAHKGAIEKNIKLWRFALNPVKNTPAEVWTKIFAMRVEGDMEAYLTNPGSQLMPSTTLKLSHVCRFWQRVVFAERKLWRFMAIYPSSLWLPSKVELLKYSHSFYPGTPALVYDSSRAANWTGTPQANPHGYSYNYNRDYHVTVQPITRNPITRNPITLDVGSVSMFGVYSLYLLTSGNNNYASHPSLSRFLQPASLGIRMLSTAVHDHLANVISGFSGFKSLEIVAQTGYASAPQQLSTNQPQLTYLKLDLTTFQPFDISGYLSPNLTEFHLTHCGTNTLIENFGTVRLPKLKVLGVTPPDTNFTRHLKLPKLSNLILYGPKLSTIGIVSLAQFTVSSVFSTVRHLELRRWSLFTPSSGGQWSIMVILNDVVDTMRSIATLKCVDSYIDGRLLTDFVEALKNTSANMEGSLLETVVIDCCSKITRGDCEAIALLVGKTEVYV